MSRCVNGCFCFAVERLLVRIHEETPEEQDDSNRRVQEAQEKIGSGFYDNDPDVLDVAVDGLLADIRGDGPHRLRIAR